MPKGMGFTASFRNGNADRRTGYEICHNRRRVKKKCRKSQGKDFSGSDRDKKVGLSIFGQDDHTSTI